MKMVTIHEQTNRTNTSTDMHRTETS